MNVYQIHDSGYGFGVALAIVAANSPQEAIGVLSIDDNIFYEKDFITELLIDVQYNGIIPCVICKRRYYE